MFLFLNIRHLFLLLLTVAVPASEFNPFSNPPAGSSLQVFSPGVISDQFGNRDMAISPAGDEMFWTMQQGNGIGVILHSVKGKSGWTSPEVASFSGKWIDIEPAFSPDGTRLYFVSKRPVNPGEEKKDYDIWVIEKKQQQWGSPMHLPAPLNSTANEFYPSVNKKGDVFFTRDVGESKEDILVARSQGENKYQAPVSLPSQVNSNGYEFNAFIDPDEEFILFTAYGRADDSGGGDLYMARKNDTGSWEPAFNLGKTVNSPSIDYCPFVSPDRKYFFFTSSRSKFKQPFNENKSLADISKALRENGNGSDDIYWMEFAAINKR